MARRFAPHAVHHVRKQKAMIRRASLSPVVVHNVTYDQSVSTWYQPMYQGGQVTYVVVNPPQ